MWEFRLPLVTALAVLLALLASLHLLFRKRDVRSAIGWMALVWFFPFGGVALYVLLGVNRIYRSARKLELDHGAFAEEEPSPCTEEALQACLPDHPGVSGLRTLGDTVLGVPLLPGNRMDLYPDAPQAYEAMLAAIERATRSVTMVSYIFALDTIGSRFVEALGRAHARGVQVRLIVDGFGMRFARSGNPVAALRKRGVPASLFLPTRVPRWMPFVNLRNHRKLMIVDGQQAFIGGLNVWDRYSDHGGSEPGLDVQVALRGPVVGQLQGVFAEDWLFVSKERLRGEAFFPELSLEADDQNLAMRRVADGPDDDFEVLRNLLLGALSMARERICIVSPYFLPDAGLVDAIATAARRGVHVDILIPERTNVRMVHHAMRAQLWQVLEPGCHVWLTPEPFDHAKLLTIDGVWALLGSANLDPRSLRLNFELNVEVYGREAVAPIDLQIQARIDRATRHTLEDHRTRSLPVQFVDNVARLWTPYL